ncbi:MAG: S24 family peptidase [Solitalea-like symbiont of Tyrophagus putrescentiae]
MAADKPDKIIVNKNYICTNSYTARIVEIFLELQRNQFVKNITEFCKIIRYNTSSWTLMSKGERSFPKKRSIESVMISRFNINPEFLENGKLPIFNNPYQPLGSYARYNFNDDNDGHTQLNDSEENYTYNHRYLPFISILEQSNISHQLLSVNSIGNSYDFYSNVDRNSYLYEVSSDNMMPKLKYGDIILIDLIDKVSWYNLKAGNEIYILLYDNKFIIKRIKSNKLKTDKIITVEDNLNNQINITIDNLQEIWQAKSIIYSKL